MLGFDSPGFCTQGNAVNFLWNPQLFSKGEYLRNMSWESDNIHVSK